MSGRPGGTASRVLGDAQNVAPSTRHVPPPADAKFFDLVLSWGPLRASMNEGRLSSPLCFSGTERSRGTCSGGATSISGVTAEFPALRRKRARRPRARPGDFDASGASQAIGSCKRQSSSTAAGGRTAGTGQSRQRRTLAEHGPSGLRSVAGAAAATSAAAAVRTEASAASASRSPLARTRNVAKAKARSPTAGTRMQSRERWKRTWPVTTRSTQDRPAPDTSTTPGAYHQLRLGSVLVRKEVR